MYCAECGKQLKEDGNFCLYCGAKTSGDQKEADNNGQVENNEVTSRNWWLRGVVIICILCVLLVAGYFFVYQPMYEENIRQEREMELAGMRKNLIAIGCAYTSGGGGDVMTVENHMLMYSMEEYINAVSDEEKAAKWKGVRIYYDKSEPNNRNNKKGDSRDKMQVIFLLMFIDKLSEQEINRLSAGYEYSSEELKDIYMERLFEPYGLSCHIADNNDLRICANMNARIQLAYEGYLNAYDVYIELIDFVVRGKGIRTMSDRCLKECSSLEDVGRNVNGFFTGDMMYYEDLSVTGRLAFLYLMPRYLNGYLRENGYMEYGSTLWFEYYIDEFDRTWDELMKNPKVELLYNAD